MEVGYGFCSSSEECRNNLANLSGREITPGAVARVLGMMVRTHTGLEEQVALQSLQGPGYWSSGGDGGSKDKNSSDSNHPSTWNVEVFVQTLKEMVSL